MIHSTNSSGLRLCVVTSPGPVTSNTRSSLVFAVRTRPLAALRALIWIPSS